MSTNTLSDYNTSGYKSTQTASNKLFSDLNLNMPIHPSKNDIIPITDISAVKAAVKNIVLTNFGEKLFQPFFGGNVTSYLFQNVDGFTALAIKDDIEIAVRRFDPRIDDIEVVVTDNSDANSYYVNIGFRIGTAIESVELNLERLR